MSATITPHLAHKALRIVFGDDSPYSAEVSSIATLTQRDLAARFRARAMELHPDRAGTLGVEPALLEREFKRLHGAYRLLGRVVEDPAVRNVIIESARRYTDRSDRTAGLWTPQSSVVRTGAETGGGEPRPRQRTAQTAEDGAGRFYGGRVPEGELRFAQFLYYNRVIDWKTMIDAVIWQYRVRPKVGEIGRSYKFLDFASVATVLRNSPRGELFGNTAMKLGLLDRRQLYVVLGKQHQLNYPIGRYFLEKGILSRPEIDHLLAQNRRHNMQYRS